MRFVTTSWIGSVLALHGLGLSVFGCTADEDAAREVEICSGSRPLAAEDRTFVEVYCGRCDEGKINYVPVVYGTGNGNCFFQGWNDIGDRFDCSMEIFMRAEKGGVGTCHWRLLRN